MSDRVVVYQREYMRKRRAQAYAEREAWIAERHVCPECGRELHHYYMNTGPAHYKSCLPKYKRFKRDRCPSWEAGGYRLPMPKIAYLPGYVPVAKRSVV